MAFQNIFRPITKKSPLASYQPTSTSTVQNQSVARPSNAYASVLNTKPVSQPSPRDQVMAQFNKTNPQAAQAANYMSGKSTPQISLPKLPVQQSVAPKPVSQPQVGYQPAPLPQPRPQQQTQQPQGYQPSSNDSYMSGVQTLAQKQQAFAEQQRKQQEDYIKQQYGLLNTQLDQSIPQYQNQFNQFKSNTEAGIADIQASGERQKDRATDYYGEAQRQAAKSRNDVRGQTQRTFANLGTLDSRGEGSFGQATENQDSEFNRYTQQNLKASADKMSEIDATVGQAERQAKNIIAQEEQKMQGILQQIQLAKSQNNLDQAQQLTQAFNQSQQYIYDIEDSVNQMKYQFAQEQEKLQSALQATQFETQGLSPEFMKSGEVKTMNDFIYKTKNPGSFGKIGEQINGQKPLSGDAAKLVGIAESGLKSTSQMRNILQQNPGAAVLPAIFNRDFKYAQDNLTDAIGRLRSGGAIGEEEAVHLGRLVPSAMDSAELKEQKLQQLESEMNNAYSKVTGMQSTAGMGSGGIDPAVQQYLASMGM